MERALRLVNCTDPTPHRGQGMVVTPGVAWGPFLVSALAGAASHTAHRVACAGVPPEWVTQRASLRASIPPSDVFRRHPRRRSPAPGTWATHRFFAITNEVPTGM